MVEIYLSDLNEEQIDIISIIGLENFLKLCEHFQGETIYFHKMKKTGFTFKGILVTI